jgi:hypothetical protein
MKKLSVVYFILAIASAGIILYSCDTNKTQSTNADINPVFEMAPPIAGDIQVKLLEKPINGANVLVTARMDKKVKGNLHAVMVGDEKLVLRDDGKEGDEKAGDGIFSIALKEDEAELQKDFTSMQQAGMRGLQAKKPLFQWVNRSAIPFDDKIKAQILEAKFDLKKGILFNPAVFFTLPPDPKLKDHSLMVTDLGVVEDKTRTFNPCTNAGNTGGAWTFGKLVSDMANGTIPAEDFVKNWLDTWMAPPVTTVNGDGIPARPNILTQIITPWILKTTPGATVTAANWKTFPLDLKLAPFKLLAIVNRLDLRGNSGYTISNGGEGRFVFGVLNSTCNPLRFTVIFEYGVPKNNCKALKTYAQQWYDLKAMTPGTPAYNTALEAITVQFTAAGAGGAGKANGSSLNQIRTNELSIGSPWELREFNIDKATHNLFLTTVKQEPAEKFNRRASPPTTIADQTTLANYVNTNEPDILANNYEVPLNFPATPFLGGKAHTETPGHFWDAVATPAAGSITNDNARHIFSLNTCSGCHGGEGRTQEGNKINDPIGVPHAPFLQIAPQPFGTKATLAAFLTGDPSQADGLFKITDPAGRPSGSPTVRGFNDLERRAVDLEIFVGTACKKKVFDLIRVLTFKPMNMTH